MSLAYQIVASCLLVCSLPTTGEVSKDRRVIWGALDHDVNLDLSAFQKSDGVEHVRWDKGRTLLAELRNDKRSFQLSERYELFTNRTLKIKHLKSNDSDIYSVHMYDTHGKSVFQKEFDLRILEMVSRPNISWNCSTTTLSCEVLKGTALELTLYQNGKRLRSSHQKVLRHRWISLNHPFKCTANNSVSEEHGMATVSCSEKVPMIYIIVGTGAGFFLLTFVVLLSVWISKRKKQSPRRHGEELEIKASRMIPGEKCPKPLQNPATAPQDTEAPQAPPPPGLCPQVPGHWPLPSSHRAQQQQKRRPPQPGTQQKGPPLPRPRVRPKPPCGVAEDVHLPSPN